MRLLIFLLVGSTTSAPCDFLESWRNLERSPVVLFERPPTGLGDILSAMVTAFWYSYLGHRRLEIDWPEARGSVELDEFAPSRNPSVNLTYYKRTHDDFKRRWRQGDVPAGDARISGNRGATRWVFDELKPAIPEPPLRAAGCVMDRLVRPTSYVRELAAPLLRASKGAVCLHIRTGLMIPRSIGGKRRRPDDEMHGADTKVSVDDVIAFAHCAEELFGPEKKWFIAADSESLRQDFVRRYGSNKIVLAPWSPEPFAAYQKNPSRGGTSVVHNKKTFTSGALSRTLAEWYALAHCDHIIASKSGFSRTAAVVAKATRNATVAYVTTASAGLEAPCRRSPEIDDILIQGGAGI